MDGGNEGRSLREGIKGVRSSFNLDVISLMHTTLDFHVNEERWHASAQALQKASELLQKHQAEVQDAMSAVGKDNYYEVLQSKMARMSIDDPDYVQHSLPYKFAVIVRNMLAQ
eukprot:5039054-Prymnesium_polylepis.1